MSKSYVATQLARQASRAIAAHRAADEAHLPTAHHFDCIAALGAEASFHACGFGEAALFMLGHLNGLAEHLDEEKGRMASRLIESVVAFLDNNAGTSRGAFAGWSLDERKAEALAA